MWGVKQNFGGNCPLLPPGYVRVQSEQLKEGAERLKYCYLEPNVPLKPASARCRIAQDFEAEQ